jgi:replication factor A2
MHTSLIVACQDNPDDQFKFQGIELSQVSFVGRIESVSSGEGVFIVFSIDDGTGRIEARVWVQDQDKAITTQLRSQCRCVSAHTSGVAALT